jgi:hypothetical protein
MDLSTLNEHYLLVQKLNEARALYETTQAKALGSQTLTGMPHGSGVSDRAGALAATLADISANVCYLEMLVAESEPPVREFVDGIEDLRTRLVFKYRFMQGMAWGEVAGMFEAGTSEVAVKNVCYSYLRNL